MPVSLSHISSVFGKNFFPTVRFSFQWLKRIGNYEEIPLSYTNFLEYVYKIHIHTCTHMHTRTYIFAVYAPSVYELLLPLMLEEVLELWGFRRKFIHWCWIFSLSVLWEFFLLHEIIRNYEKILHMYKNFIENVFISFWFCSVIVWGSFPSHKLIGI